MEVLQASAPTPLTSEPADPTQAPAGSVPTGETPEASPGEAPQLSQKEAERLSPKFAALAKKEAQAVRRLQEATTKEQALRAREEAIAAREAKLQEYDRIRGNPAEALRHLQDLYGVKYEDLTAVLLNGGEETADMRVRKLEERLSAKEQAEKDTKERETKAQREAAEKAAQEAEANFKANIDAYVEENAAKLKLVKLYARTDLIYDTIEAHYQQTLKKAQDALATKGMDPSRAVPEIMGIDKASELVEAYLRKQAKEAAALASDDPVPTPTPGQASGAAPKRYAVEPDTRWVEKPVKTLSNAVQPSVSAQGKRPVTDEDRIARALERLRAATGR